MSGRDVGPAPWRCLVLLALSELAGVAPGEKLVMPALDPNALSTSCGHGGRSLDEMREVLAWAATRWSNVQVGGQLPCEGSMEWGLAGNWPAPAERALAVVRHGTASAQWQAPVQLAS